MLVTREQSGAAFKSKLENFVLPCLLAEQRAVEIRVVLCCTDRATYVAPILELCLRANWRIQRPFFGGRMLLINLPGYQSSAQSRL